MRRHNRGIWVIADLTYEKLVYEPVPHNLPRVLSERLRDRAVLCSAASKAYAMTGWRAGWAIGPAPLIAACNAVQGHSTSNVYVDHAEGGARRTHRSAGKRDAMLDEYRDRRDKVFDWMTADPLSPASNREVRSICSRTPPTRSNRRACERPASSPNSFSSTHTWP